MSDDCDFKKRQEDFKQATDSYRDSQKNSLGNLSLEKRKLIDIQLEKLSKLTSNMGIDSSPEEKSEFKEKCKTCLMEIKEIDEDFYNEIDPYSEEKIKGPEH